MKLVDKPLTEMQKNFARLHVENSFGKGQLSNTESAIKAGYAPESAYTRAYELLNPRICPHVVKYIADLKEDFRKKNNIDPDKHMGRLHHLGLKAEENKMYGIALQSEIARGKVAGYYVDRKLNVNKNLEEKTEEEIEEELRTILNDNKELIGLKKELKKGEIDYGQIKTKNNSKD
jgi:phage terminase small subunit